VSPTPNHMFGCLMIWQRINYKVWVDKAQKEYDIAVQALEKLHHPLLHLGMLLTIASTPIKL